MRRTGTLTKCLATTGVVLAWIPILATVVLAVPSSIRRGTPHVDYLMPAELFPAAFLGGALLLWAAVRARSRQGAICWGYMLMLAQLVGGQALAVVTGLASGAAEPAGWPWVLVVASLVGYTLALVEVGGAGILLLHDLFSGRR